MAERERFHFPSPPGPAAAEWPGSPIGVSDTITRTKGRTAKHDKTIDRIPGLRDELVGVALEHMRTHRELAFKHDVVIHGVRVRALTNSPHLSDFWVENWYGPVEWERITGQRVSPQPQIEVYAFTGVAGQEEAAYYSRATNTVIFFNTAYYGQLKSWVLGAVGRVLAEEYGVHSIHGACVGKDGKGVLYISPTGTGKSTASYGLMAFPHTRFHSDDWVYVRYVVVAKDGRRVAPLHIVGSDGQEVRGYRVFRWLEKQSSDRSAHVVARGLDDQTVELTVADLDLAQPMEAYAYISEKVFYLRANLVENFPESAYGLLHSKFENLADVSADFLEEHDAQLARMVQELWESQREEERKFYRGFGQEGLRESLARMFAFDNARAMLDIGQVFSQDRIFANPLEPVRLASVFLIKRDRSDPRVLESLSEAKFMTRLLIGETPDKKREIAYNAYRAVDDDLERTFVDALEGEALAKDPAEALEGGVYERYQQHRDVPATLEQDFELFRVLYRCAQCYDLNTILARDPSVRDLREAVARTMALLGRVIDEEPSDIRLTLDDYQAYLKGAELGTVR